VKSRFPKVVGGFSFKIIKIMNMNSFNSISNDELATALETTEYALVTANSTLALLKELNESPLLIFISENKIKQLEETRNRITKILDHRYETD
jgi:hypothetical protein